MAALGSPDFDPAAAVDAEYEAAKEDNAAATTAAATGAKPDSGAWHWIKNLPKNIDVGLIDAAVNTIDAGVSFAGGVAANVKDAVTGQSPSVKAAGLERTKQFVKAQTIPEGDPRLVLDPVKDVRPDGSKKGMGFLGPLQRLDNPGGLSSELSVGVNIDGKEVEIPSIVPTLTADELRAMLSQEMDGSQIPPAVMNKAVAHAKQRLAAGLSPFAQPGEQPMGPQEHTPAEEPNPMYDAFKARVLEARNTIAMNTQMASPVGDWDTGEPRTQDAITQGISQFMLPFLGWTKLLGGVSAGGKMLSAGRAVMADAVTSATVLQPHDPRMADLVAMGKQSEGQLGRVLNTIAPDGSLMNSYIDYMTDRDNETEAEGRFKNALDSFAVGAAFAGVLKTGATTLKLGRQVLESSPRVGAGAQGGHLTFHGTPHEFDAFDASKIGTGEGAQVYGHGLYFAENKGVAQSYQRKLAEGVIPMVDGSAAVPGRDISQSAFDFIRGYGDIPSAVKGLRDTADNKSGLFLSAWASNPQGLEKLNAEYRQAADWLEKNQARIDVKQSAGMLAHVEIPDEKVAKMLLWDKPLSEQPGVLKALEKLDGVRFRSADSQALTGRQVYEFLARDSAGSSMDGQIGQRKASQRLAEAGIPGIRYKDQGSRGKAGGTHNIVLFDPADAKIVKKE